MKMSGYKIQTVKTPEELEFNSWKDYYASAYYVNRKSAERTGESVYFDFCPTPAWLNENRLIKGTSIVRVKVQDHVFVVERYEWDPQVADIMYQGWLEYPGGLYGQYGHKISQSYLLSVGAIQEK